MAAALANNTFLKGGEFYDFRYSNTVYAMKIGLARFYSLPGLA